LLVTIVFGFAILFSHEATSFYLTILFAVILLALRILKAARARTLFITFLITVYLVHFSFVSEGLFANLLRLFQRLISPLAGEAAPFVGYYGGFFQLELYDQVRVLMVELGRDLVVGLLSIFSILVALKLKFQKGKMGRFYYVLVLFSFLPVSAFLLSSGGMIVKSRFWNYFCPFSPFLVGITLWYLISRRPRSHVLKRSITTILVFALICISVLQTYPCQPLIPKVSTEYGDRYVKNYRRYTDFIQRSLVFFVARHNSRLSMSTTSPIQWQIYGLTEPSFQALLGGDPVRAQMLNESVQVSLVLISGVRFHYGGYALELEHYLREALETKNVIYTNGEAYCFSILNSS